LIEPLAVELAKNAWISRFRITTPGDPRSMRKFDRESKAEGSALTESCNHEEDTIFYATAIHWVQSTRILLTPILVKIVPSR
jgi:hypothetical protein